MMLPRATVSTLILRAQRNAGRPTLVLAGLLHDRDGLDRWWNDPKILIDCQRTPPRDVLERIEVKAGQTVATWSCAYAFTRYAPATGVDGKEMSLIGDTPRESLATVSQGCTPPPATQHRRPSGSEP
jgi:hypothetical protein